MNRFDRQTISCYFDKKFAWIGVGMELRRLRYFVITAEELHVARAAERIGISQPALSQQIKVLETSLGARLFDRVNRGIRLTTVGEAFLPAARLTVDQADRAVEIAHAASRGQRGRIDIGYVSSSMLDERLPETIGKFRLSYPDVELRLKHYPVGQQIEFVADGRLDVAFVRLGAVPEIRSLRFDVLSTMPVVAAVPADHKLLRDGHVRLKKLSAAHFLVLQETDEEGFFGLLTRSECARAGFEPIRMTHVADMNSLLGLVSAGLGVALVPQPREGLCVPNVAFASLSDVHRKVELRVVSRRNEKSQAVRNFLRHLNSVR